MKVSANGFPQLKVLQLSKLTRLTKLNIGQNAMPWLMQLEIHPRVKILGFSGLLNLVDLKIIFDGLSLKLAHRIWLAISTGKLLPWDFTRYLHSSIYSRSLELPIFLLLVTYFLN